MHVLPDRSGTVPHAKTRVRKGFIVSKTMSALMDSLADNVSALTVATMSFRPISAPGATDDDAQPLGTKRDSNRENDMNANRVRTFSQALAMVIFTQVACGGSDVGSAGSSGGMTGADGGGDEGIAGGQSGSAGNAGTAGEGGELDGGAGTGGTDGSAGANDGGVGGVSGSSGSGGSPECVSGDRNCDGTTPQLCDASGHWQSETPCEFICTNGQCEGECEPNSKDCDGNVPRSCSLDGAWQLEAACEYLCEEGSCVGVCHPGEKQCQALTPEFCNSSGAWTNETPCPYSCENGMCVGDCAPGSKDCLGNVPRTCSASFLWDEGPPCEFACVDGECQGVCVPGTKRCSGKVPETCDVAGQWAAGSSCPYVCANGVCSGVCSPGAKTCDGNTPKVCDASGHWTAQSACSGQTPFCEGGECVAPPVGEMTVVNGPGFPPTSYLIDSKEVTRAEYEGWLLTNPSITNQPTVCRPWNTTFAPTPTCMAKSNVCSGGNCDNHPIVCVDWCDARAYCAAVGKHLCGRIGGGVLLASEMNDPNKAQWYRACSSGGTWSFPYGNTYAPNTCNGKEHNQGTTVPTGSMGQCQSSTGGYHGVFDLSGNVFEWEDACEANTGQYDRCGVRGGGFTMPGPLYLTCHNPQQLNERRYFAENVGFRCCKEL